MILALGPYALRLFLVAALVAGLVPFLGGRDSGNRKAGTTFPGWPAQLEGRPLTPLPLTAREAGFVRDFPGRIGRFSDGSREIILRWVAAPTRKLHPAADCLRGSGYTIVPLPARISETGAAMSCFRARRGGEAMSVCEVIRDEAGSSWPDVSAWYWHALTGRGRGPWWSLTIAWSD